MAMMSSFERSVNLAMAARAILRGWRRVCDRWEVDGGRLGVHS